MHWDWSTAGKGEGETGGSPCWTLDLHFAYTWAFYALGARECGRKRDVEDERGWDYSVCSRPCLERQPLNLQKSTRAPTYRVFQPIITLTTRTSVVKARIYVGTRWTYIILRMLIISDHWSSPHLLAKALGSVWLRQSEQRGVICLFRQHCKSSLRTLLFFIIYL